MKGVGQELGRIPYAPCANIEECYGSTDQNASVAYVTELGASVASGNRASIPDVIIIITTGPRPSMPPPQHPHPVYRDLPPAQSPAQDSLCGSTLASPRHHHPNRSEPGPLSLSELVRRPGCVEGAGVP